MRKLTNQEYKQILLEMLVKIDKLCQENGIKYSLGYGTLLGAVRHKGFIPWDDDADIMVPRDDYKELIRIINSSNCGLKFITNENTKGYCFPFGKICDVRTKLYEGEFNEIPNYGAYVDVFPMIRIPLESKWRNYRKWKRRFLLVTYSNMKSYTRKDNSLKSFLKYSGYLMSKFFNSDRLLCKLISDEERLDAITKTNHTQFEYGLLWDYAKFPDSIFEKQIIMEFEGCFFKAPSEYDTVLRSSYSDYMKLPPIDSRVSPHKLECYIKDSV